MAQMTEREEDAAIIERSLREPECFAELFDRYHGPIHGYAERRLTRPLADDIAAETFLIAFRRRDTYDLSRPDARPWLYGIASNLISRHHGPRSGSTARWPGPVSRRAARTTPTGSPPRWRTGPGWRRRWPSCPQRNATCCCWSPGPT